MIRLCGAAISARHRSSAQGAAVQFLTDQATRSESSQHRQQQQLLAAQLGKYFIVRLSADSHRVHGNLPFFLFAGSPANLLETVLSFSSRGSISRHSRSILDTRRTAFAPRRGWVVQCLSSKKFVLNKPLCSASLIRGQRCMIYLERCACRSRKQPLDCS